MSDYDTEIDKITAISQICDKHGLQSYRKRQIYKALFKDGVKSYSDITTLPLNIREILNNELGAVLSISLENTSTDKNTTKYLFKSSDGHPIETVFMKYKTHTTACISTQSGCQLKCKFCATGAMGFKKNLTVDEIYDQILYLVQQKKRPDNIVAMGMGEPLLNNNFYEAIDIFTSSEYFGYGQRRISVSTVGIVPGVIKLSQEYPQVNISFSLHSPIEDERLSLMPVSKAYPIVDIFNVLNTHIKKNHRKIFVAYILISGLNDTKEHAIKLAQLIKDQGEYYYLYHVNLIKYHQNTTAGFSSPTAEKVKQFSSVLFKNGISNTIRQNFGEEVFGACGQLEGKIHTEVEG